MAIAVHKPSRIYGTEVLPPVFQIESDCVQRVFRQRVIIGTVVNRDNYRALRM